MCAGLGYYELRLNGEKVGDHELDPAWTSYGKRMFYSVYDVTGQLRAGIECRGMYAGRGMVRSAAHEDVGRFNLREALAVGKPLRADSTGGGLRPTERPNGSARTKPGRPPMARYVRTASILARSMTRETKFPGWDAPGFDGADWDAASVADAPKGELAAQPIPPIRVTDAIPAKSVHEVNPGVFIFDMGENLAGPCAPAV